MAIFAFIIGIIAGAGLTIAWALNAANKLHESEEMDRDGIDE